MSHQLWRSLISVLLIAGLIIPTSIWSAPSVVAAPLTAAQPQTRSLGQIIFAPAIDADGDSATNPIESAPVPIAQLPDRALGIVAIAAQLQATDARTRLLNTPVTLRIWQSDRLIHDQTYRTDEWGAIVIRVPVTDIAGEFRYQATASGYGETAMRLFRFDPTLPTITLRGDGAQLTTQLTSNGQVRLTLNTSFDLQADRDEATVQLARQPRDVPAQAAALVKSDHAVWLPFPEVKLNLVDAHTAQIDLQLPPGAYRAVGAVTINAAQAVHSLAQPQEFQIDAALPTPDAADAIWVATREHERGQTLVRYTAPAGQAIFALVDSAQAPAFDAEWDTGTTRLQAWRVGAFEWVQEIYRVEYEPLAGVEATLSGLGYDPIARRYTFAVRAPLTTTANLQIEVLGVNDTIVQQHRAVLDLPARRVLSHAIDVPAELGRPYGVRVSVSDPDTHEVRVLFTAWLIDQRRLTRLAPNAPLDDDGEPEFITSMRTAVAHAEPIEATTNEKKDTEGFSLFATLQFKLSFAILGAEVASLAYTYEPGEWEGSFTNFDVIVEEIVKNLAGALFSSGKLALFSGSVNFALDIGIKYTAVDPGCDDPTWEPLMTSRFKVLADEIDSHLPPDDSSTEIVTPAVPVSFALYWWVEGALRARFKADSGKLSISFSTRIELDVTANFGFYLTPIYLGEWAGVLKFIRNVIVAADVFMVLAGLFTGPADLNLCDPDSLVLPDFAPPDDRQDVWQQPGELIKGGTLAETINHLHDLIARSRVQHLTRAETYLSLHLRQAELRRFVTQPEAYQNYLSDVAHIAQAASVDVQGILSGTIPITPGLTITDAIVARNAPAIQAMTSLPYATQLRARQDDLTVAQRAYQLLYGQELELQAELRQLLTHEVIGVLAAGFPPGTLKALRYLGLPGQLISPWPGKQGFKDLPAPYLAPDAAPRVLIVPAGGLHAVAGSNEARLWLEDYVAGGGQLIVFTQAFGTDWQMLPGGQVRAVGYTEDDRCAHDSVLAMQPSNWLVWMGDVTPDIQVDGAFLAWPSNANVLLTRTSGTFAHFPALIEYAFGQGHVLATTAYGDWSVQSGIWWGDDWQMTRAILIRAYLLMTGRDVASLHAASPGASFNVSFPVTNTSSAAIDAVDVSLPLYAAGKLVRATVSLTPEESRTISAKLTMPARARGVHSWTQSGLFHVKATLIGAQGFTAWGPFVYSPSGVDLRRVSLILSASASVAPLQRAIVITSTVRNDLATPQTVVVRGWQNYPTQSVTLTLAANSTAVLTHSVVMTDLAGLPIRATLYDDAQHILDLGVLNLYARPSLFYGAIGLPPVLSSGAPLTSSVTIRPNFWTLADETVTATHHLTLTAPNQTVLWSSTRPVPGLTRGQINQSTDTLANLEPTMLGTYTLTQDIVEPDGVTTRTRWAVPARVAMGVDFDRAVYQARGSAAFTVTLKNTGLFDLSPAITITVPHFGVTQAQTVSLPVGHVVALPVAFTLPAITTSLAYPIIVSVTPGNTVSQTFTLNVPPSNVVPTIGAAAYQPGATITATLINAGGVDTSASYAFSLIDRSGLVVTSITGTATISAGVQLPIGLAAPIGLWAGRYTLRLNGVDQATQRSFSTARSLVMSGIDAQISARSAQPTYTAGDSVTVTGALTATAGTLSGTIALNISRAQAGDWVTGTVERVNPPDEAVYGVRPHEPASLVRDAAGNAYAVWSDGRHQSSDGFLIYFAYQPANGAWSANERVGSIFTATWSTGISQHWPDVAIDASGNTYVTWEEYSTKNNNVQTDIFFAMRYVTGTWTTPVKLNTDAGTSPQQRPAIASDPAGNVIVLWEDRRAGALESHWHTFYATRSLTGTWSADQQMASTAWEHAPDVAMDASGTAHAVWTDYRTAASRPDIYFARKPLGGAWTAAQIVNDVTTNAQLDPAIAVSAAGDDMVAWTDYRGGASSDIYFAMQPAAGVWSASQKVNDDATTNNQASATLAIDVANNTYVAWEDYRNATTNPDLYFATRSDLGAWSANERLTTDPITSTQWQYSPTIAVDASGNALTVWTDGGMAPSPLYPTPTDTRYAVRPVVGMWSASGVVNDDVVATSEYYADLKLDAAGNAYATWSHGSSSGSTVYFAYRAANGTWQPAEQANDPGPDGHGASTVAIDTAGNAYLVWTDARNRATQADDIYFARRAANGAWSANERVNDDSGVTAQTWSDIDVDAQGRAYAVWTDARNGGSIYFATRSITGTWSANEQVTSVAAAHSFPAIAVDDAGNAYAVWMDKRESFGTYPTIYFAYRPVTGTWGANVKISGVTSSINNVYPDIAVDAQGRAYAVWSRGNQSIYFAARSITGTWSAPSVVAAGTVSVNHDQPALTVDAGGNAFVTWKTGVYSGSIAYSELYFAYRPVDGAWRAPVLLRQAPFMAQSISWPAIDVDGVGNLGVTWHENQLITSTADTTDIQFVPLTALGGAPVWSQTVAVPQGTTTQAIDEAAGTLNSQPGKYWLAANFRSALSQTIVSSLSPFYIFPAGTAATLDVNNLAVRPGDTLTITGRVTNTSGVAANLPVTITANNQIIFTQTFALNPTEGAPYSVPLVVSNSVTLKIVAGAATMTENVTAAAPQAQASLSTPSAVAVNAPFSATVTITNTGVQPINAQVAIGPSAGEAINVSAGQVALVQRTLTLTSTTTLTASVRGDVTHDLTQIIQAGPSGTVNLIAPATHDAGSIALGYIVTGTNALPGEARLILLIDNVAACTETLTLAQGVALKDNAPIELPAGTHTLSAQLHNSYGQLISSDMLEFSALDATQAVQPRLQILGVVLPGAGSVNAGGTLTVNVSVKNTGVAAPVIAGVQVFDLPQQIIVTPTAYATSTLVFTQSVPNDLPAGVYVGQIIVDDQSTPFTATVTGVNVQLGLQLDRPTHLPGELISVTARLTETAGIGQSYRLAFHTAEAEDYITVTLPAYQTLAHTFTFTATATDRAAVSLAYVPAPGEDGQRTIMIDSVPVAVAPEGAPASLSFDRAIYQAGDTISLTLNVPHAVSAISVVGPQELWLRTNRLLYWTSPVDALGRVPTGTHPLTYTLPTNLRSGQYTFVARMDGGEWPFSVDVRGTNVTTRRMTLDQAHYGGHDPIAATVEFVNEGSTLNHVRLNARVAQPDGRVIELTPSISRTVNLAPGLNTFTVTGVLSTSQSGPQRLIVSVSYPGEPWHIASAMEQFDMGGLHLIDLTTDHGSYTLNQAGVGRLDAYGFGAAQLVVTATNGATLLNVAPQLAGFKTYTFALPTDTYGDYQLAANGTDGAGQADRLMRAYAVPLPPDTHAPTLTLTSPATTTIIYSNAPTLTLPIAGHVTDDRGPVTVLLGGRVITTAPDGVFATTQEIERGLNGVSLTALDASGNITSSPTVQVYVLPPRGSVLSVNRSSAQVGDVLKYQIVLTTTGAYSGVVTALPLPAAMINTVTISASSGYAYLNDYESALHHAGWLGDVSASQPVTITVQGTLRTPGALTTTATTYWGLGFKETHGQSITVDASTTRNVYLPLVRR